MLLFTRPNRATRAKKAGARRSRAASASSVLGSCSQREQLRAAGRRCAAVSPPMQRMRARSWVERRRLPCAHLRKRMMHSSRNHTGRLGVEISTCLRARLRGHMTDEPSGHRDGRRAKKKSTRGGDQSVLPDGLSCAVWSMFGVLEDAARRALQLQRLGWVIWVRVGLRQCSDGWSGGVVVWQIQSHRIKYNMYLERLAYEPNVSEV